MDPQKFKDNLTKLETKTDNVLVRAGEAMIRFAKHSYTVGVIAIVILIAVIVWAWW